MDDSIEKRVEEIGVTLLEGLRASSTGFWSKEHWISEFAGALMEDEALRIEALRFIDVLPTLTDDADLVHHLQSYFESVELPLSMVSHWGLEHADGFIAAPVVAGTVRASVSALARNFIGGENAEQIGKTVEQLWGKGYAVSIDLLGEAALSEAEVAMIQQKNSELLQKIPSFHGFSEAVVRQCNGADLSIKCSSLYSQIGRANVEDSVEHLKLRIRPLLQQAMAQGVSVTFDMEQYDHRHLILRTFRELLMEPPLRHWSGVGIALQSYLRECHADLESLIEWAQVRGAPVNVRLVRGAYWDTEVVIAGLNSWEVPVWMEKGQTDANYEACLQLLFEHYPVVRPVVATHNVRSQAVALALAEQHGVDPQSFEFQVLYGMGEHLGAVLTGQGVPVRIYVPVGELIPGMSYLVRRLLENTTGQSFIQQSLNSDFRKELLLPPDRRERGGGRSSADRFRNEPPRRFVREEERRQFAAAIDAVSTSLGGTIPLLIGGKPHFPRETIHSLNPADPSVVVGEIACANGQQAEDAVVAAREAAAVWGRSSVQERIELLQRVAGRLRERRDEFAAWEIFEVGKSWQEADADVIEAIDFLEYYAREAGTLFQGDGVVLQGEINHFSYQPRGVVLVIPPWNFPLAIVTGMVAAALVTGNSVILKPASDAPVVAWKLVELMQQCGMPDGVINFIPGPGETIGEQLVQHPDVDMIAFTGSQQVGCRINALSGQVIPQQHHLKHVIAEMGGKNAVIVDRDADLDEAVKGVIQSAFGFQGQKCSAASCVVVVDGVRERFIRRLTEAAASIRIGAPDDPANLLGPVISKVAHERILGAIEAGKQIANLALQVEPKQDGGGYFIGPVIFTEVPADSFLAQEEIFGPVLSVIDADSFEQAIETANATRYGLTGGVYSRDPHHLELARHRFNVGNLYLNRGITGALVGRQPFGGFNMSGTCNKTGGRDYLLQFVHARTVTENSLRRGFAPTIEGGHG